MSIDQQRPNHVFDLLPPRFRHQNRIQQIRYGWLTFIGALVAILGGVSVATLLRDRQAAQHNLRIASAAIPLTNLRREVLRLQDSNQQRQHWCQLVEGSRPDDCALQALAVIADASNISEPDATGRAVRIDSIALRMPIEFPWSDDGSPDWAKPRLTIAAEIATPETGQYWVDRLNQSDRIETAAIGEVELEQSRELQLRGQGRLPVELSATPIATRVMP